MKGSKPYKNKEKILRKHYAKLEKSGRSRRPNKRKKECDGDN